MRLTRARDLIRWPSKPAWKRLPVTVKLADAPHVQQVRQAADVARRGRELAVLDRQLGVADIAGQQPVLVVVEAAAPDGQLAFLEADAGAVAVGHAAAAELDVVDLDVTVLHDPGRLALGVLAVGVEQRARVLAADREPALRDDADLALVGAGHDLDRVAVLRTAQGLLEAHRPFLGADGPGRGVGSGERGAGERQRAQQAAQACHGAVSGAGGHWAPSISAPGALSTTIASHGRAVSRSARGIRFNREREPARRPQDLQRGGGRHRRLQGAGAVRAARRHDQPVADPQGGAAAASTRRC